ncbi:hypothetical protein VJI72_08670, partial [Parvimonas micra]|uniref:hypothetical protein n=1 Tax=Parvimonas micra TaxID=33033 RepID=UPI002B470F6D
FVNMVVGSYLANNLVYGGALFVTYQSANPGYILPGTTRSVSDYFYTGSGGGQYYFSNGNDVFVGYAGADNRINANPWGPYAVN